ncbi:MAG: saccharopine dehydrogenase C-terminal domain-containing protein [bacterium]
MKVAVFGAGMMARAAVFDLVRQPDVTEVRVADREPRALASLRRFVGGRKLRPVEADAADLEAAEEFICGTDVAVSCVPYPLNFGLAEAAIACGAHFCDLGGNNDAVADELGLDRRARRAGVTLVPDCGLAPGLVGVIAADAVGRLDRCESLRLRVGGLPRRPKPPFGYGIVFSAEGLVNEYAEPCRVLRRGRARTVPPLADLETLSFPPLGRLEAFSTSGGVSTLTETLRGVVRELDYKTIRYPGHCAKVRPLFELGLASTEPVTIGRASVAPRELLVRRLEAALGFERDDLVLLRVDAAGTRRGRPARLRYRLFDRADRRTGLTAMMRCTGFPVALAALTLGRGLAFRAGALPGELAFEPGPYLAGLRERGLRLTVRPGRGQPRPRTQPPRRRGGNARSNAPANRPGRT